MGKYEITHEEGALNAWVSAMHDHTEAELRDLAADCLEAADEIAAVVAEEPQTA